MHNKDKIKSGVITLIGIILTVYGLILCVMSNLNIGVLLVVVLGFAALLIGVFYSKVKQISSAGIFRICKISLVILLCIEVALISFIAIYGVCDNAKYNEDAVIVLGAGIRGDKVTLPLKMRLDKAIEYYNKNPESVIVVTGGQGFQETVTEAYAMEKYLLENGIDKNKIIKEEKATSTSENMIFSKEILDDYFQDDYSVVVVTNNFHVLRGTKIAEKSGFDNVTHIHAGLQWYNLLPCYLRESLAVIKLFVLG